jgi:hypothetical protein
MMANYRMNVEAPKGCETSVSARFSGVVPPLRGNSKFVGSPQVWFMVDADSRQGHRLANIKSKPWEM